MRSFGSRQRRRRWRWRLGWNPRLFLSLICFDTHLSGTSDDVRPRSLLDRWERAGKRREEALTRDGGDDAGIADSIDAAGRRVGAFVVQLLRALLALAFAAAAVEGIDNVEIISLWENGERERDTRNWERERESSEHASFLLLLLLRLFFLEIVTLDERKKTRRNERKKSQLSKPARAQEKTISRLVDPLVERQDRNDVGNDDQRHDDEQAVADRGLRVDELSVRREQRVENDGREHEQDLERGDLEAASDVRDGGLVGVGGEGEEEVGGRGDEGGERGLFLKKKDRVEFFFSSK